MLQDFQSSSVTSTNHPDPTNPMKKPKLAILTLAALATAAVVAHAFQIDASFTSLAGNTKQITVGLETTTGTEYILFASDDAKTWIPVGDPFLGNGLYKQVSFTTSSPAKFYRISEAASWDDFTWDEITWR